MWMGRMMAVENPRVLVIPAQTMVQCQAIADSLSQRHRKQSLCERHSDSKESLVW